MIPLQPKHKVNVINTGSYKKACILIKVESLYSDHAEFARVETLTRSRTFQNKMKCEVFDSCT